MTATTTRWGTDRLDPLGTKALGHAYAAPTRAELARARDTDSELICRILVRLGPELAERIGRFSPDELAILAHLERTST